MLTRDTIELLQAENAQLRAAAQAATDEAARYRTALLEIRVREGRVCPSYEICTHVSCSSSYAAWAIADSVLDGMNHDEMAAELAAPPAAATPAREGE